MTQPDGFESSSPNELCFLQKTLYGLKQSPRERNLVLHKYLVSRGFIQSKADTCIYVNVEKVDDIVTVRKPQDADIFRKNLRAEYGITEGRLLEWYLGIAFNQLENGSITLDQKVYLDQKLYEFKEYIGNERKSSPLPHNYQKLLQDAEDEEISAEKFPYRKTVGNLMYAMLATRPDLSCAISVVSQYLENSSQLRLNW